MSEEKITVLIRTINRATLKDAINSARREFKNVIVIADDVEVDDGVIPDDVDFYTTGRKFDSYGSAAINLGAYVCKTEFFCLLDDDDEFFHGAGKFMHDAIQRNPEIDIWVPGLEYSNGNRVCMSPGLYGGNVGVPTYRTTLLFEYPFHARMEFESGDPYLIDFTHVRDLVRLGYKIDWYCKCLIAVRPWLNRQ